ncbi:MAG: hypothetical protein IAI50_05895 [Candidatus Eremiobacteraeota bacterium]|nr:hypothetical protein [Candidatus Eremiobacteraeota bacterium]
MSIGDEALDVSNKIDVYLGAGSELVIAIDPRERSAALHDRASTRIVRLGAALRHETLPGFEIELATFFATALDLSE